jgi:hypothetical protein
MDLHELPSPSGVEIPGVSTSKEVLPMSIGLLLSNPEKYRDILLQAISNASWDDRFQYVGDEETIIVCVYCSKPELQDDEAFEVAFLELYDGLVESGDFIELFNKVKGYDITKPINEMNTLKQEQINRMRAIAVAYRLDKKAKENAGNS